jgi:hypothetical protein
MSDSHSTNLPPVIVANPVPFDWLRDTTPSYRMGFVEGLDGQDYLLIHAAVDASEYQRGLADGSAKRELDFAELGGHIETSGTK